MVYLIEDLFKIASWDIGYILSGYIDWQLSKVTGLLNTRDMLSPHMLFTSALLLRALLRCALPPSPKNCKDGSLNHTTGLVVRPWYLDTGCAHRPLLSKVPPTIKKFSADNFRIPKGRFRRLVLWSWYLRTMWSTFYCHRSLLNSHPSQ